jgi:hypothetical protein
VQQEDAVVPGWLVLLLAQLAPVVVQRPDRDGDARVGEPDVLRGDDPEALPDVVAVAGELELGCPVQRLALQAPPDRLLQRRGNLAAEVAARRLDVGEPNLARSLRESLAEALFEHDQDEAAMEVLTA